MSNSIRYQKLSDFEWPSGGQAFCWSVKKTVLPTVIFSTLTVLGLVELLSPKPFLKLPTFIVGVSTLGFLVFAAVAWAQTRAGLGSTRWIAILDRDCLWIKIRSPLNRNLGSSNDLQVVGIPLSLLTWSQGVAHKTIHPAANNRIRTQTNLCLDLGLVPGDYQELASVLDAESGVRQKNETGHLHHPLTLVEPEQLRVNLTNVSGGAKKVQNALPGSIVQKDPTVQITDLR